MKLLITHRHQQPSPSFTALITERIEALAEVIHIDEAHIQVEHQLEASPPFRLTAHLVTPGPDLFADSVDHTLRAALEKLVAQLEARIEHKHQKRAQRVRRTQARTVQGFSPVSQQSSRTSGRTA